MTVLLQLRILFKFLFEIIWKIVIKCKKNVKGQKKLRALKKYFVFEDLAITFQGCYNLHIKISFWGHSLSTYAKFPEKLTFLTP